jgi:hypothetical protein
MEVDITNISEYSHFYFQNQNHIDLFNVEILYLPQLNRLEEIYNR